jgi:hypothetical protein
MPFSVGFTTVTPDILFCMGDQTTRRASWRHLFLCHTHMQYAHKHTHTHPHTHYFRLCTRVCVMCPRGRRDMGGTRLPRGSPCGTTKRQKWKSKTGNTCRSLHAQVPRQSCLLSGVIRESGHRTYCSNQSIEANLNLQSTTSTLSMLCGVIVRGVRDHSQLRLSLAKLG